MRQLEPIQLSAHPGESRDPGVFANVGARTETFKEAKSSRACAAEASGKKAWVPAFAGMSGDCLEPQVRGQGTREFPAPSAGLEEATAAAPQDWAQAAAFALHRAARAEDPRPVVFVAGKDWRRERGGLSVRGLFGVGTLPERLILVRAEREAEALWALEEALKSGAVAGGIATVEQPSFVATRRLDFAAREGRASAVLLRAQAAGDLSAARLRWRVLALPSAPHPFDPRAPGALRLKAELARRRDGPLGAWELEQDHETHRLGLAAGLADHGLVQGRRPRAA
jgi:protein ImuA